MKRESRRPSEQVKDNVTKAVPHTHKALLSVLPARKTPESFAFMIEQVWGLPDTNDRCDFVPSHLADPSH